MEPTPSDGSVMISIMHLPWSDAADVYQRLHRLTTNAPSFRNLLRAVVRHMCDADDKWFESSWSSAAAAPHKRLRLHQLATAGVVSH